MAIIFGAGLGLFMDEIGLLLTWGNYASRLSYLLGVFLLAILLNVIYFPGFWGEVRKNIAKPGQPGGILNRTARRLIALMDRITGNRSTDN